MATTTTAVTTNTAGRGELYFEGGRRALLVEASFTFSNSYATNGEVFTLPSGLALGRELKAIILTNPYDGTRFYQWDGSKTAPKITAWVMSTGAEVANATDLSAVTARDALLLYAG
jgi:hypothetical protein